MTVELALRMSVLNALIEVQDFLAINAAHSFASACDVLQSATNRSSSFDYDTASELIIDVPHLLRAEGTRSTRLQYFIRQILDHFRPRWLELVPNGRNYLRSLIEDTNALQCLDSASLYTAPPSDDVLQWWDALAQSNRNAADDRQLEIGRIGERLTLDYESRRLLQDGRGDLRPLWTGVEDNTLGYDVRSFTIVGGVVQMLYIEVKATYATPARFFLTRNEWDKAVLLADHYVLYLWQLPSQQLHQFTLPALQHHVPADTGNGRWQKVEIHLI